jgi:NAD(P)H-dependent FMN reductase
MTEINVLVLVGSLRAASVNRQLAELAAENAPDGVTLTVYDALGDVPFYNEDIDNENAPAAVDDLRAAATAADAALVVTPEYNGSIPAVLKNAIDWLSRQYGGVWAHDETRKSFGIAGPTVVESVKLSISGATLDGKHPGESPELVASLRDVVGKLVAEVG